jgi:hypothetical protein
VRTRSHNSPFDNGRFLAAISEYGSNLGPRMRGDGRNEDRLRSPIGKFVERMGEILGITFVVHDEVTLAGLRSRPDMAIDAPSGRVGYIELKAPGKETPETWRPTTHDREQWEKLKALPNLIYTDGSAWALYRKGELVGRVGLLAGDLARAGHRLAPTDDAFERLIRDFLLWRPERPKTLRAVVSEVAPLCRLLRDQVEETLGQERGSGKHPFTTLAMEWRTILFPNPDDDKGDGDRNFADSYAQAVTFGLLLARVDGVSFDGRTPAGIAEQLSKQHSLLGEALSILAHPRWVNHLNVVDILVRVIGNIDWSHVQLGDADTYARLYETFLGDYDPELRQRSGTYYTPAPVARSMVAFVDHVLKTRLGKRRGFAADDVVVLDPAMGAGTFLAEVLENAANTLREERGSDAVPAAHLRDLFEKRLMGFELQAAPFAVAELRLHAALKNRYQVEIPTDEPRFLTNALDDPYEMALDFGQLYEVLKESRDKANRLKRDVPVMVVIGNPPWRERARGAAPWLEKRREPGKPIDTAARPSLDEFRLPGNGRLEYNLSNMWTYFWRWAAWKAFEANEPAGVVALITPSAYLTSKSHAGMRQYLRRVADEGWIIDLSPENHRSTVSTRIFPGNQHAICIGIFVRSGVPQPDVPAPVHYTALAGTQQEKFAALASLTLTSQSWEDCPIGWQAAFRPVDTAWDTHPLLGDLLPWQQSGVKSNRNWVYAPDSATLLHRWHTLINADELNKPKLFKETDARIISRTYCEQFGFPSSEKTLSKETSSSPRISRVAFRSFDRQYLICDLRALDRPRSELWQVSGDRQIYASEQHSQAITTGSALSFSAQVPDMHYFNNRGGRALPLFRDAFGNTPNCVPRLLPTLGGFVGSKTTAEDLLAYIAAVVAHSGYTTTFQEQLKTPGIRVPITLDAGLWREAVEIGREVLWLHTYGERSSDQGKSARDRPQYIAPVPTDEGQMPESIHYDEETETLVIGEDSLFSRAGRVHPVRKEVWDYTVGGMHVVRKWLSYRHPDPKYRKRTSPLDDINPTRWTAQFDDELLELLHVLDRCVALEPIQADLLARICAGPLVTVADLEREGVFPVPQAARKPPRQDPTLL